MLQDLRYALRQLRHSPGFAAVAIVTLALGIGANAAIFTLIHGILLRSLPVANPAELYRVGDTDTCCFIGGFPRDDGDFAIFSYDEYKHLEQSSPEFEHLAALQPAYSWYTVRRQGAAAFTLRLEYVSGNYFNTLGVQSYLGRMLSPADDTAGANPVAVLSYAAWQQQFGGDASVMGSTLYIQQRPFTIVGVMPPGFYGDRIQERSPEMWIPLAARPVIDPTSTLMNHSDNGWLYLLGRVRPGTSIPALQAKMSVALQHWLATRPAFTEHGGATEIPKQHVVIVPAGRGIQNLQEQTGTGLRLLMILAGVVLLIACANIANLLLARSTARRSEVAVRMALGAGRTRLMRQIFSECVLLACIGGVAGLGIAYAGSHMILALAFPQAKDMPVSSNPSLPILGFAFVVSLLTGILFGTAPAWLSSHAQPAEALRGVNRSAGDKSTFPQKALVIFQVALSVVLLAGAVLMTRSLANLEHQNFGLSTANRYVLEIDPEGAGYKPEALNGLYRTLEERFGAIPGIAHVGLAMYSPLAGNNWAECVIPQGKGVPPPGEHCGSTWDRVNKNYLDSIGVSMVRGRNFNEQDTSSSPQVVIVNQAFVKRFFPGQDPIGKHFGIDYPQYSSIFEIVGVFADFKMNDPREAVHSVFLRPMGQEYSGFKEPGMIEGEKASMYLGSVMLNFSRPQPDAESLVRRTLAEIDPNLTIFSFTSFDAQVAGNFNQDRLVARLTMLFGMLALVLASVGLYGVISYFVVRRTAEIGIRMALGATRGSVLAMVLRGALWQILIGLGLGIPAALLAGHLVSSQLYGVGGYDPLALLAALVMLSLCATVAGLIPARRAASIEPMKALRDSG